MLGCAGQSWRWMLPIVTMLMGSTKMTLMAKMTTKRRRRRLMKSRDMRTHRDLLLLCE